MITKIVKVNSSIEAKDVALIVQTSNSFKSNINITISNKTANAKSIMGLIALGNFNNEEITITTDGEDETKAIEELSLLFTNY